MKNEIYRVIKNSKKKLWVSEIARRVGTSHFIVLYHLRGIKRDGKKYGGSLSEKTTLSKQGSMLFVSLKKTS